MVGWANAGKQEQLGGVNGSCAQNNLSMDSHFALVAIGGNVAHPCNAAAFVEQAHHVAMGADCQIGAAQGGAQVCFGRALPPAVGNGGLIRPHAILGRAVKIGVVGQA